MIPRGLLIQREFACGSGSGDHDTREQSFDIETDINWAVLIAHHLAVDGFSMRDNVRPLLPHRAVEVDGDAVGGELRSAESEHVRRLVRLSALIVGKTIGLKVPDERVQFRLDLILFQVQIVALSNVRRITRELNDVAAALGGELLLEVLLPDVHGVIIRIEGVFLDPISSTALSPHDLIGSLGLGRVMRTVSGPADPNGADSADDIRLRHRTFRGESRSQIRADSSAHSSSQSIDQAFQGLQLSGIHCEVVKMK